MVLRCFSGWRRLSVALLLLPCLWLSGPAPAGKEQGPDKLRVYVGTYTAGTKSKGIYRLDLDLASGQLTPPTLAGAAGNPSFLALHPNGRFLYAVNESNTFLPKKTGAVTAFAIDSKGDLTFLNHRSSGGAAPCHLIVDKAGKNVLAANYSGGNACVLPIRSDGRLGEATSVVQSDYKGSGVNKGRQEGPHAHSINLDAANRFAFVADLGLDKVLSYRFDSAKGTLKPTDPPAVDLAPGAGPRHFAFHPDGRQAYVINELDSTITTLSYDPERGALKTLQTVSTLPKSVKGNSTAEVQVHPSGKFVYGSNRGHNSIAIFKVAEKTGELTPAGHQGEGIKVPRNFGIDPTGAYLLVANQAGDTVLVFRINRETGALTPTGGRAEVPAPVCIRMMAPGK